MTAILHQPGAGEDAVADRIAAAALEQFAEFGIRRSTMDDIARRAGVSKMTVFRRFTNKQGLVEDVIARELRRALEEIDRRWGAGSTIEERLVEGFVFAVSFVSGHPLFDKLLRAEPELLLPLLTVDGGPVLALYRTLIAERLQVEVDAGRAAPANVDQASEVIARLAISLLLTREGSITLDDRSTIEALVRDTLLPMLRLRDRTGTVQLAGNLPVCRTDRRPRAPRQEVRCRAPGVAGRVQRSGRPGAASRRPGAAATQSTRWVPARPGCARQSPSFEPKFRRCR